MGIGSGFIGLLSKFKEAGLLEGKRSVIEIGAQQLSNSFIAARKEAEDLGRKFGVSQAYPLIDQQTLSTKIAHGALEELNSAAPYARPFYEWLGYSYAAVDIDGSPNSIPLDLNYDPVPKDQMGQYSLVTNFGTTEHVANQLNAFKVIHDLTAQGGLMVHELPAQGFFNHGLVNYNVKFFWMLARSNLYQLVHLDFTWNTVPYDLPANILDEVKKYVDVSGRSPYRSVDGGILAVLRKNVNIPFVAPLDVPTGTKAPTNEIEQRYWTVFAKSGSI